MIFFLRQVCLFLKRGANQNAADIEDKTPLSIAVEAANADIVTLWESLAHKQMYFLSLFRFQFLLKHVYSVDFPLIILFKL